MHVFELTRALVHIESITGNEEQVGNYLFQHLSALAARYNGRVEKMPILCRANQERSECMPLLRSRHTPARSGDSGRNG